MSALQPSLLPERPDARALAMDQFGRSLFSVTRDWRRVLGLRLRPHGLQEAAWRLLLHLDLLGGSAPQARLAERMGIETPSLVRLLDRMERDGWVRRVADASDRRIKQVRPTPRGRAIMAKVANEASTLRSWVLADLDLNELARINAALALLQSRLEVPAAALPSQTQSRRSPRPAK